MSLVLGYDIGTSSVKVGLYRLDGSLVAHASRGYPLTRPRPGWVEQDPDDYWTATVAAVQEVLAQALTGDGPVVAAGCCGQAPTLVLLDADGRPVRPAIVWQDTRAAGEAARLTTDLVGDRPRVDASSPVARLHWLAAHEPTVLARARFAISAKDCVTYRLTGEVVADFWTSRGLFACVPTPDQPEPPPDAGLLWPVVPRCRFAHEVAGIVTPAAAAETGLPPGVPVAAGWSDGLAACLGTGALARPGIGLDISGTSEMIGLCAPARPAASALLQAPIPGARHWAVFGPTQASGDALAWACRLTAMDPAAAVDLAATVPPGAAGLVFLPYLAGERAPIWDPNARGLLFGLTAEHEPAHVLRAVLEGVAYSVRHVLTTAEADAGLRAEDVRTAGGGSRFAVWNQIKADVTGRPFVVLPAIDTGTLGAAILGMVAAGLATGLSSAATSMVQQGAMVTPDPALAPRYDEAHQIYAELYPRLQDMMHASSVPGRQPG